MNETNENLKREVAKNYQSMSKISSLEHSIVKMKQHGKALKRQNTKANENIGQLKKEIEFIMGSRAVLQKIVEQFENEKSSFSIEIGNYQKQPGANEIKEF